MRLRHKREIRVGEASIRRECPPAPARAYIACKFIADASVSLVLLIVCAPLLVVLAAMVKLTSPGPVFYSQTRLGRGGREYRVYKLRTMLHECEAATGAVWALEDDPRTTPIGRFLRDTHLDELPQLWNVLRGEMSLIGPRPERPEIAEQLERIAPAYRERLSVRPGMTGLAQLSLPADGSVHGVRRKLAHDLHYVRHVSFALDLQIVLATVFYFVTRFAKSFSLALIRSHCQRADRDAARGAAAHDGAALELQLPLLDVSRLAAKPVGEVKAA